MLLLAPSTPPVWAQDEEIQAQDIQTLVFGLNSPDDDNRAESARALGAMGIKAVPAVPALIYISARFAAKPSGKAAHEAVLTIGTPAVPTLCEGISGDMSIRLQSIKLLRDLGAKAKPAVGCLTKAAQGDFKGDFTTGGFENFRRLSKRGTHVVLMGTASDFSPRNESQMPTQSSETRVVRDTNAQAYAVNALGEIGAPAKSVLPLLETFVERYDNANYRKHNHGHPTLHIREAALNAILKLDTPTNADIKKIIPALKSTAPGARAIAAKKLGYLAASDEASLTALLEALKQPGIASSSDYNTINDALRRIVAIHPEVLPRIQASKVGEKPSAVDYTLMQRPGQPVAQEDVPGLIKILNHSRREDLFQRRFVLKRLGEAPSSTAVVQALANAIADHNLSETAVAALGQHGPAALPALRPILNAIYANHATILTTISKIGPGTHPELKRFVKEGSTQERAQAAAALGGFPSVETADFLFERLAVDTDPTVHHGIIGALARIGPLASAAKAPLLKLYKSTPETDYGTRKSLKEALVAIDGTVPNKQALVLVRTAISNYFKQKGTYPSNLTELIPDYLRELPILRVPGHPPAASVNVATRVGNSDALSNLLHDSGYWLYVSDPISPINGAVVIDCKHKDSFGQSWSSF